MHVRSGWTTVGAPVNELGGCFVGSGKDILSMNLGNAFGVLLGGGVDDKESEQWLKNQKFQVD